MRLPARRARIDLGLKPTSSENPRLEDLETLWRLSLWLSSAWGRTALSDRVSPPWLAGPPHRPCPGTR